MESNSHESPHETGSNKPKLDQRTTIMESLPREIVIRILTKLPLSSFIRSRCVCRAWKELAQDQYLADLYDFRSADKNQCLVFYSHDGAAAKDRLCFVNFNSSCTDEWTSVKEIETPFGSSAPKLDVLGSCNGLLCLSCPDHNDQYIYNPFTGQYKVLPKTNMLSIEWAVFGFGFHPKTNEYKVVKLVYFQPHESLRGMMFPFFMGGSEVQVFTLGTSSWRSLGPAPHHLKNTIDTQVLVNGRLHWLTSLCNYRQDSDIVSFDLEDEQFRMVAKPDAMFLSWCDYLVVLSGCLSAVMYDYNGIEIWVMKEYDVKLSWVKGFKVEISSHLPKALSEEPEERYIFDFDGRFHLRVLCELKNGEFLLEYESRALVVYDSETGSFKDLVFQGLPQVFQTVFHLGNLRQVDAIIFPPED